MASKKVIQYISLDNGRCGLSTESPRDILHRIGTENVRAIRPASQKEVDWVRAMGGDVPDGIVRERRHA
jgi:hypothetical protein